MGERIFEFFYYCEIVRGYLMPKIGHVILEVFTRFWEYGRRPLRVCVAFQGAFHVQERPLEEKPVSVL